MNGKKAVVDKARIVAEALLAKLRGDEGRRGRRGGGAMVIIVVIVVVAGHGKASLAMGAGDGIWASAKDAEL